MAAARCPEAMARRILAISKRAAVEDVGERSTPPGPGPRAPVMAISCLLEAAAATAAAAALPARAPGLVPPDNSRRRSATMDICPGRMQRTWSTLRPMRAEQPAWSRARFTTTRATEGCRDESTTPPPTAAAAPPPPTPKAAEPRPTGDADLPPPPAAEEEEACRDSPPRSSGPKEAALRGGRDDADPPWEACPAEATATPAPSTPPVRPDDDGMPTIPRRRVPWSARRLPAAAADEAGPSGERADEREARRCAVAGAVGPAAPPPPPPPLPPPAELLLLVPSFLGLRVSSCTSLSAADRTVKSITGASGSLEVSRLEQSVAMRAAGVGRALIWAGEGVKRPGATA